MSQTGILWLAMMAALVLTLAILGCPWFRFESAVVSDVIETIKYVAMFAAGAAFKSGASDGLKQPGR